MSCNVERGEISVLFKVVGRGTDALSTTAIGTELNMLGPIGRGFDLPADNVHPVLLGGGVGIPPMLLLANTLKSHGITPGLVTMGSEVPFPFAHLVSAAHVSGVDEHFTGTAQPRAVPELEAAGIASRLASTQGYEGCFDGFVTDLTNAYVQSLPEATRAQTILYACGPTPMLKATAVLAQALGLKCYVSLEEFMACAVGGCAGCVVPARNGNQLVMRRVCVDGPVFDAGEIVWEQLSH
jgi:dihydroorotate dehydrogenase electron transfer subunit